VKVFVTCKFFSHPLIFDPMSLPAYIEKHGIDHCAKQWKVSPRTVRYWKERTTRPTRKKVKKVMETSGLTIADIYG